VLVLALAAAACVDDVDVGRWKCATSTGKPPALDAGGASVTDLMAVPWGTGFEDGFCDYAAVHGFCYSNTEATYDIVTSPVHSGKRAAAFRVSSDAAKDARQARCVREGALPSEATYGAWFYVPASATNGDNWNLMHFQYGDPDAPTKVWDVSLGNAADGSLYLYLYDSKRTMVRTPKSPPKVPIGSWFHVEFYWRHATDTSGEVTLFQDGEQTLDVKNISTSDTPPARWYVGDLVDALDPPDSTIYVDDVAIRAGN